MCRVILSSCPSGHDCAWALTGRTRVTHLQTPILTRGRRCPTALGPPLYEGHSTGQPPCSPAKCPLWLQATPSSHLRPSLSLSHDVPTPGPNLSTRWAALTHSSSQSPSWSPPLMDTITRPLGKGPVRTVNLLPQFPSFIYKLAEA